MQTKNKTAMLLAAVLLLSSIPFFSFSPSPDGGDVLEVYLNQNLLIRQYVYIDKGIKTISLADAGPNDELKVYYSHCGSNGKNRTISITSSNHSVIKKWKYADATGTARSVMSCTVKDILALEKNYQGTLGLYYSSAEIPDGKQLVNITNTIAHP